VSDSSKVNELMARYDEAKDWLVIVESLCKGKMRYSRFKRALSECRQRVEYLKLKVSETIWQGFTKADPAALQPKTD
jgi:hypothetical protein